MSVHNSKLESFAEMLERGILPEELRKVAARIFSMENFLANLSRCIRRGPAPRVPQV